MRGVTSWSARPYRPALDDVYISTNSEIYIVRIEQYSNYAEFDWTDKNESADEYTIIIGIIDPASAESASIIQKTVTGRTAKINGLSGNTTYDVYIKRKSDSISSSKRIFYTGYHPGKCINYLHPKDNIYSFSGMSLCSPSIVRCESGGYLLASMDVYGSGMPQNLTIVYRSDDNGESWSYVCDIFPCFWGKLFCHRDKVYMLGMSTEYGDILIGTYDGEYSFNTPTVLFRGSCSNKAPGNHRAPMPVIEAYGRLWTSVEFGAWTAGSHCAAVLSCSAEDDLLCADNWTMSDPLPYNSSWEGVVSGKSRGNLEGNVVLSQTDGKLYNIMRYQTDGCIPSFGKSIVYQIDINNPESPLIFDRIIDFPGNLSKFEIQYDKISKKYWCILSRIFDPNVINTRNVLSLAFSENLFDWNIAVDLLDYSSDNPKLTGFQYVSFIFTGDDILYLCRTAISGANNFHDANYSTLHRIKNFRNIL